MSGRSPKYIASVAPQQEAPDMIVQIIQPIIPVPVLVSIEPLPKSILLWANAMRKSGKPKIITIESATSV
jgi:hypothetical protein